MSWQQMDHKTLGIVGLTLAIPVVILIYLMATLWMLRLDYQAEIERLEPRIARLSGLVDSEAVLKASSGKVGSRIVDLVYPNTQDRAAVAADLQRSVRELMAATGLNVSNSRILGAQGDEEFDRIGLSLTVTGSMSSLDATLEELAAFTPLLLVGSLEIRPNRVSRRAAAVGEQTVTANMQVLSLRAAQ
jgi:general secretion pathway protein M